MENKKAKPQEAFIQLLTGRVKKFHPYGNQGLYTGQCPSCRHQRLVANPSTGLWKCFDCGIYGNAADLVMRSDLVTYADALKIVNGQTPEPMPENERVYYEMNSKAALWFRQQLLGPQGAEAMSYLKKDRRLTDDTIRKFALGYAGKSPKGLLTYIKKQGYTEEQIKASGLFQEGKYGLYDRFYGRVMFPIIDERRRVIGFGGRILDDDPDKPKYLNSPETGLFHKGHHLFAMNFAKDSKEDYTILCEGYMDVIALHQAGFDNAFASLGTSLTSYQAMMIARQAPTCVISYDADAPGMKAAARAIPLLRQRDVVTKWVSAAPAKDPDEHIKTFGADSFRRNIAKAQIFTCENNRLINEAGQSIDLSKI